MQTQSRHAQAHAHRRIERLHSTDAFVVIHSKGLNRDLDVPIKRVGGLSDGSDIQHRLCRVFDQSRCRVPPRAVPVKNAEETYSGIASDLRTREWARSAAFVTVQAKSITSRKVLMDRGIFGHFWWHSIGNTGVEAWRHETLPLQARNSQEMN